ncbi:MAG: hypothetical protein WA634_13670, partial [Silvibacterium sp.]
GDPRPAGSQDLVGDLRVELLLLGDDDRVMLADIHRPGRGQERAGVGQFVGVAGEDGLSVQFLGLPGLPVKVTGELAQALRDVPEGRRAHDAAPASSQRGKISSPHEQPNRCDAPSNVQPAHSA